MPRKESEPLKRLHIHLFERDWERIQLLFADNIGESKAIRHMVRKYLDMIEAKATEGQTEMETPSDDIIDLP